MLHAPLENLLIPVNELSRFFFGLLLFIVEKVD